MTSPQGRRQSARSVSLRNQLRRAAVLLRRGRWIGRGWPLHVNIGPGVRVTGTGLVELAPRVTVGQGCWINAQDDGVVSIGAGSSLGQGSIISALGRVEIAERVLFGPYVLIQDHLHGSPSGELPITDQQLVVRGRVRIERGAWLGSFVSVVPGADDLVIGENAIIGAGSVVTRSVPPRAVVVGPSAKPLQRPGHSTDQPG